MNKLKKINLHYKSWKDGNLENINNLSECFCREKKYIK